MGDIIELSLAAAEEKKTKRQRRTREVTTMKKSAGSAKKLTKKDQQMQSLAAQTDMPDDYHTVWTVKDMDECCDWLLNEPIVSIDSETTGPHPWLNEIVGISLYAPHRGYYIPLKHGQHIHIVEEISMDVFEAEGKLTRTAWNGTDYIRCLEHVYVGDKLRPLLEDRSKKFIGHNCKFDSHILRNWLHIDIRWYFDTMIGQAILDENQSKRLKDIASKYLGIEATDLATRAGNLSGCYAIKDAELAYRMWEFQYRHLTQERHKAIHDLLFHVEMPFLQIVVEAEAHGVKLDVEYLTGKVAPELHADLERLRQRIWAYTGRINLDSAAQVSEALYVKLGLPRINKQKPDATDQKTFKLLKPHHPVIDFIQEYKEKAKLTQAFADKLPKAVINGRVHTSFNPVGAKTGRMSCNNPNLQQIPAKVGGLIRNAFISESGRLLASIDFRSQEIRVLAHVSKDKSLLALLGEDKDIHSMTAASMWNLGRPESARTTYEDFEYARGMTGLFQDNDGNLIDERFTDQHVQSLFNNGKIGTTDLAGLRKDAELGIQYEKMRKMAKVVNFGIIYGMSKYKLSDTLDISVEEAEQYINAYFTQYPGVRSWMEEQRNKMRTERFTSTMLGRKRRVHQEMMALEFWKVQRGFRQGINAVIQGSSADMTKLASIRLQPLLKEIGARIVLWVHDEIIFDVPEAIGSASLLQIADIMCNALPLECGMKSDIEVGTKWGQKMSLDDLEELRPAHPKLRLHDFV